jgi:RAB protein geranylgeranyltransferase component A
VPSLAHARKYNLDFSPQLIYARSTLLGYLVSSKVFRQLEFLAVGSWWVYTTASDDAASAEDSSSSEGTSARGKLLKVPNGREDVFQDQVLDFKAKRALMKFLRFIGEYEEQGELWEKHRSKAFSSFLSEQFKVPVPLQAPLLALTLSPTAGEETTVQFALPRIARHLRSIGVFGAGFGAVIPKWGGMSEIAQVACRASAVGGGVYVLGKGVSGIQPAEADGGGRTTVHLKDGESVTTKWLVEEGSKGPSMPSRLSRSITIISSPLTPLFPPLAEDAPSPASAVVVFPSGALSRVDAESDSQSPPVHIFVHSSDTEECPKGQSEYPHAIVPRHFLMNNLMNTYLHCLNNIDDIISDKLILA